MDDPRKALPLTPASVSTVTTPSCTVPPKAVPTPVFHGSVCQLHRSTLTLLIFTCTRPPRRMVPDGAAACRSVDAGPGGLYRAAMNDEQRFLFDLQGFLVVPGVLSAAELAALNAIADEKAERYSSPVEDWEEHQCSFWGQPLVDLIDHPKVVPTCWSWSRAIPC